MLKRLLLKGSGEPTIPSVPPQAPTTHPPSHPITLNERKKKGFDETARFSTAINCLYTIWRGTLCYNSPKQSNTRNRCITPLREVYYTPLRGVDKIVLTDKQKQSLLHHLEKGFIG